MLSIEGHQVDCVADGAAAVSAAAAMPYDLILMDMIIAGDGRDRGNSGDPRAAGPSRRCADRRLDRQFLFRKQLDSCLAAGMDATLTKPMSIDSPHQGRRRLDTQAFGGGLTRFAGSFGACVYFYAIPIGFPGDTCAHCHVDIIPAAVRGVRDRVKCFDALVERTPAHKV